MLDWLLYSDKEPSLPNDLPLAKVKNSLTETFSKCVNSILNVNSLVQILNSQGLEHFQQKWQFPQTCFLR